jgi:hypothetical protein
MYKPPGGESDRSHDRSHRDGSADEPLNQSGFKRGKVGFGSHSRLDHIQARLDPPEPLNCLHQAHHASLAKANDQS